MDQIRAAIVVARDSEEELREAEAWFSQWRNSLALVSENLGCGCCVDIFEVEGPPAVIDTIPPALRSRNRSGAS
jgi:hypothetical protein